MSQNKIAKQLNISQSTISREISRNRGKRGYRFKQAQISSDKRRLFARKSTKMTRDLTEIINSKIKEKWSPEQISGWLREKEIINISYETIYKHILSDKRSGGHLFKSLRRKGKAYQSRCKLKQAGRGYIKNPVSIDKRPQVVDNKTSFTVSMPVADKSAKTVTATIALLKPFEDSVITITADNGKEFAYHEKIKASLKCDVYFADPYCSWQRGLNENTNDLLRQYWPKSTDFKKVSNLEVQNVILNLNDRPRKKLNYKTPAKLMAEHMAEHMAAIAA